MRRHPPVQVVALLALTLLMACRWSVLLWVEPGASSSSSSSVSSGTGSGGDTGVDGGTGEAAPGEAALGEAERSRVSSSSMAAYFPWVVGSGPMHIPEETRRKLPRK